MKKNVNTDFSHSLNEHFIYSFLLLVGEIFIPFFTGQVIDSIVIDKSHTTLVKNIIFMSLISFAR